MAERDLAVVAGQHVEAEQRDRVGEHQRELEDAVVAADHERQRAGEHDHDRHADEVRRARAERSAATDGDAVAVDGAVVFIGSDPGHVDLAEQARMAAPPARR